MSESPFWIKRTLNAFAFLIAARAHCLNCKLEASWNAAACAAATLDHWRTGTKDNQLATSESFVITRLPRGPFKDSWVVVITTWQYGIGDGRHLAAIKPEMVETSVTKHAPMASATFRSLSQSTSFGYEFALTNINFGRHKLANLASSLILIELVVLSISTEMKLNHEFGSPKGNSLMKRLPRPRSSSIIRSPKRRRAHKTARTIASSKLAETYANLHLKRAEALSTASCWISKLRAVSLNELIDWTKAAALDGKLSAGPRGKFVLRKIDWFFKIAIKVESAFKINELNDVWFIFNNARSRSTARELGG